MTRLSLNTSFALLAVCAAALLPPLSASAQSLSPSEVRKGTNSEKSAHDVLKTLAKEVIKKPLNLNPLTGKILDLAIDYAYDKAKRKYYDPRHVKDVLIKYRSANFEIQKKAFAKRKAIKDQLQDIDTQLSLAPGEDTIDQLLRKRRSLLAEQDVMDDVIDIVNKRVSTSLQIQRNFDAGGDVPAGLDRLLSDFNDDIGAGSAGHAGAEGEERGLSCAELEAEERRVEIKLKNEVVGRSDQAALAKIQAAAAVLQEIRAQKKNCTDQTATSHEAPPAASARGNRPAGAACSTGQDCADGICAAGTCIKEGAGGLILGE